MTFHWQKKGAPDLLLIFGGFGLDHNLFEHLDPGNRDVLVISKYGRLTLNPAEQAALLAYRTVDVAAWSFGVWVFAQAGRFLDGKPGRRLAIAGSLWPVDRERGIAPAIFQRTLAQFNEAGRAGFYRNFFTDEADYERFAGLPFGRTLADQQAELAWFAAQFSEQANLVAPPPGPESGLFTKVLIPAQDRIIPARAQRLAWSGWPTAELPDSGHCPFLTWSRWQEAFDGA